MHSVLHPTHSIFFYRSFRVTFDHRKMATSREDVKLLGHWASIFVTKVSIALNLKGVEHEFLEGISVGGNGEVVKSELLLNSNPVYKKIPVLIHGGKPVCESSIIVQYIDQVWAATGPSILPSDPYERARARFWAAYIDEWILKLFATMRAATEEAKSKAKEETFSGLQLLEGAFKELSNGKSFFGGENIGFVDIVLGCNLGWIGAAEELCGVKVLDDATTPRLVEWADKFRSHDAVKGVMPETEKYVEFGKLSRARWNAEAKN